MDYANIYELGNRVRFDDKVLDLIKGYVLFYLEKNDELNRTQCAIYLGAKDNHEGRGFYDNSDDSLIFLSNNEKIWTIFKECTYILSKEQISDYTLSREDFDEFGYILNKFLKDLKWKKGIAFHINDMGEDNIFKYPA